jgi:hypothetical protein
MLVRRLVMFSMLAILVYLVALGLPLWLLHRYGSQMWLWHAVAIAASLALGFIPTPVEFKGLATDLIFGFAFLFLMVWGVGGLVVYRPHLHRHA